MRHKREERRVVIDPERFRAAIFDMDGVITRTAALHAQAWKELFDEYFAKRRARGESAPAPFDIDADYHQHVDGRPRYDGVSAVLASRGISIPHGNPDDAPELETVCGLGNRKDILFWRRARLRGVRVYESSRELINRLRSSGLRTAIFSASKNAEVVLRLAGVVDLFDARVDGTVADKLRLPGKPHPAMLIEATSRLGVEPGRTVVFEDAIAGVQAGRAGRFGLVVGVNRGGEPRLLINQGADVEVSDLSEVCVEAAAQRDARRRA